MVATFASLGMAQLTPDEKLEVLEQLWEELATSPQSGSQLSDTQREELLRRKADAAANPDDWVSWEEIHAATLQRYAQ